MNVVKTPPICFCGSETEYTDSAPLYHGRSYGMRWICKRFPDCKGSVGAHPDGKPLGTVPDADTKILRGRCHAIIDPIWQNGNPLVPKKRRRGSVYRWLMDITGLPVELCHVGMWDAEQCKYALKRMSEVPYEKRKELLPRYQEPKS